MSNRFFDKPILNNPYEYPKRHWELDDKGQPTQQIVESRRKAEFITPMELPRFGGRVRTAVGREPLGALFRPAAPRPWTHAEA